MKRHGLLHKHRRRNSLALGQLSFGSITYMIPRASSADLTQPVTGIAPLTQPAAFATTAEEERDNHIKSKLSHFGHCLSIVHTKDMCANG